MIEEELKKIKEKIESGNLAQAKKLVDDMLRNPEYNPYKKALYKLSLDIRYAEGLNKVDENIGKKALDKVVSEINSVTGEKEVKKQTVKKSEVDIAPTPQQQIQVPIAPIPPPPPLIKINIPKELINVDPYDFNNIDILHEMGPFGIINDLRRTVVSIFDPLLPLRILSKELKKGEE